MKFGIREKIFSSALMAVSVFFILYDHFYLKPQLEVSLNNAKQVVYKDVKIITELKKKFSDPKQLKKMVQLYTSHNDIDIDSFPTFLLSAKKKYTPKDPAYQIKNILVEAFDKGRAEGEFTHQKTFVKNYAVALLVNDQVEIYYKPLTKIYKRYDNEKTYLITTNLIGLLVAFFYAHILSKKIR